MSCVSWKEWHFLPKCVLVLKTVKTQINDAPTIVNLDLYNLIEYSLIQKNGYTSAIVYSSKFVSVFLNQTLACKACTNTVSCVSRKKWHFLPKYVLVLKTVKTQINDAPTMFNLDLYNLSALKNQNKKI